ncbi:MAG: HAD family phosphatase [Victivallaceae bacterium]|nr:HAD family phosphatase [Victivallaceae bacterium]
MAPRLYMFDMDHTLIDNDCDVSWKHFLARHGLAPASAPADGDRFFEQYKRGELDLDRFFEFQFKEFIGRTEEEMRKLAEQHFEEMVRPKMVPQAVECVQSALNRGAEVAIVSSTNSTLARPVAAAFGIATVAGTELEMIDGRYTGRLAGAYGLGEGKLISARSLAKKFNVTLDDAAYYGDSINDRYILTAVGHANAVDPDPELEKLALANRWHILRWRTAGKQTND